MLKQSFSLEDKHTAEEGRVFLSGIRALARLAIAQKWRDRAVGPNTAVFISVHRGSPLGGHGQQLAKAKKHLAANDIVFRPGVNEDLVATAVRGAQHLPETAARQLIVDYAALVEHALKDPRRENRDAAVALFSLYGEIRGYGPVKEAAAKRVRAREPEMRAAFEKAGQQKRAA